MAPYCPISLGPILETLPRIGSYSFIYDSRFLVQSRYNQVASGRLFDYNLP
jgi:hypothetical protein